MLSKQKENTSFVLNYTSISLVINWGNWLNWRSYVVDVITTTNIIITIPTGIRIFISMKLQLFFLLQTVIVKNCSFQQSQLKSFGETLYCSKLHKTLGGILGFQITHSFHFRKILIVRCNAVKFLYVSASSWCTQNLIVHPGHHGNSVQGNVEELNSRLNRVSTNFIEY